MFNCEIITSFIRSTVDDRRTDTMVNGYVNRNMVKITSVRVGPGVSQFCAARVPESP